MSLSDRNSPIRPCGKRYDTELDARCSKRGLQPGAVIEPCWIPGCGGWHVKTPATPAASLERGSTPPRTTKLNPVSDKRRAENRERRIMADTVFGDRPPCGIRWGASCQGLADDLHEVLSRGRGGSITDAGNCLPGCRWCHTQVTTHPAEAEARGFALPSGRPSNAAPRWWAPELADGAA